MTNGTLALNRSPRSFFARYGWPLAIATVLIASAGSNIIVMMIAKSDPAFAVEPDYYKKAVEWDATMAQERANANLRWSASAQLRTAATPESQGSVAIDLTDNGGSPVVGATVAVEAMHNARAADRLQTALREVAPGHYVGTLAARRAGAWELRVTAVRNSERYTQSVRVTGVTP